MILQACEDAAVAEGFTRFEMGAPLTGVPFYRTKGYVALEELDVPLGDGESLPIVKEMVQYGISPRSYHHLLAMSRAAAFFHGRDYVSPVDVKYIANDVWSDIETVRTRIIGGKLKVDAIWDALTVRAMMTSVAAPEK